MAKGPGAFSEIGKKAKGSSHPWAFNLPRSPGKVKGLSCGAPLRPSGPVRPLCSWLKARERGLKNGLQRRRRFSHCVVPLNREEGALFLCSWLEAGSGRGLRRGLTENGGSRCLAHSWLCIRRGEEFSLCSIRGSVLPGAPSCCFVDLFLREVRSECDVEALREHSTAENLAPRQDEAPASWSTHGLVSAPEG